MAKVDITADMNEDVAVTIADATAAAGNHLFQFFTDGKNVFNIASQELSGDSVDAVTVNVGVSYEFVIPEELALLLDGTLNTYKHFSVPGDALPTQLNYGDITVTPITGSTEIILASWANLDRVVTASNSATLKADEDIIFGNPPNLASIILTLPDADTMIGKRFEVKNIGQGAVRINTPDGTQLIYLDTTGDNCLVRAKGNDSEDWEVFFAQ